MAEAGTKTGILALAQKQLSRTKTKVLQNLGKAEKTTDDVFNDNVIRIEKQQEVAHHLQKELKAYAVCMREMATSHRNLTTALAETYEPEWTKEASFRSQLQTFDLLWNDCIQTILDSVIVQLNNYQNSFPTLKAKIAKCGRKMTDFDNARHNLEVLLAAKKKDDLKIQKAQEEMKEARKIYEQMNEELHEELPEFNNSRVSFYAGLMSSLFSAEQMFHSEVGKINGLLNDTCQELAKDFEQFAYKPKRPLRKTGSIKNKENGVSKDAAAEATTPSSDSEKPAETDKKQDSQSTEADDKNASAASTNANNRLAGDSDEDSPDEGDIQEEATDWKAPSNEPVTSPPPNCLFKVMATYCYRGEDLDELNFEPGEVIYVIPFENPEDQDEGWQMGIKASDGIQGVFPENFTQRI